MSARGVRLRAPVLAALSAAAVLVLRAVPAYGAACDTTKTVKRTGGGDYAGIQAAVNAVPATLTGNYCIVIDSATYGESVVIQGKDTGAAYRINIFSDPSMISTAARVNPPAGSTAAFQVFNASVTLTGISVISTNTMSYGIYISSSYVLVSSVNVDSGGRIGTAGIVLSSWTVVTFASVTVQSAHALYTSASNATISRSTGINSSGSFNAMSFYGADSNTVTGCFFSNSGGDGLIFNAGSDYNAVAGSTANTGASAYLALSIDNSDFNLVTGSVFGNPGGTAGRLLTGAEFNTIDATTFTSNASGSSAFFINGADWNVVSNSYVANPAARALRLAAGATNNTVSGSTMASNAAGSYALSFDAATLNTVIGSLVSNPAGYGAYFAASADRNVISLSTIVSAGADPALYLTASSSNTVLNSYVQGSTAALISGSTGTVIGGSVFVATNTTGSALALSTGSVYLTVTTSSFRGGPSGAGIFLDQGNSGLITLTSNTFNGGRWGVWVATMNCGGTCIGNLSISSMIVSGPLTTGATAIQFEGGAFVSTFAYVNFGAANIAVNVNARPLSTASRITMRTDTGVRTGSARENDQNALVYWPSEGAIDGCVTTQNVGSGRALTTITAGVSALPTTLTGHSCVVIRDGATYAEQVTVRNFVNNGSSITILADPLSGLRPVVSPPASSTAAFLIANASVNVVGIDIAASQNAPFGISASSGYVTISSVNVSTSGSTGFYTAGVRISSWSAVSYSMISVGNAYGLWLFSPTGGDVVGYTGVTVRSNPNAALNLQASSCAVTGSSFSNQLGNGVLIQSGAAYNIVRQSTMTSSLAGNYGLFLSANFNTLIDGYFANPAGYAMYLSGAVGNTISLSTITSDGYPGLYVAVSASNTFLNSYVQGSSAAVISGSTGTVIGGTVFVATNTTGSALALSTGSVYLTVTTSSFRGGPSGAGIFLDQGNSGLITLTSNTINGGRWGVWVATMSCGGTCVGNLSISSMIVSGPLAAGATAIQLAGGAFVSTFAYVNFGAASIAVNVNGQPLALASRITMNSASGAKTGPALESDPSGLVDWSAGPTFAGCVVTANVDQLNGPYTTISAGAAALPTTLTGHSCVVIRDGATYAEQVTVRNFVNNGSSITILADPLSGLRPVVSPPAASTAAFLIANASVNVLGVDIAPGAAVSYGIAASSAYVTIASVNVRDAGGLITEAGMSLASWGAVSYSSVTVQNAYGISLVASSMTAVSYSSAQSGGSYALYLNAASSNSFTVFLASSPSNNAAYFISSQDNDILASTMIGGGASFSGLYLIASDWNTLTGSLLRNPTGAALTIAAGSDYNAVSGSTMTSAGSGQNALYVSGSASNTITGSYVENPLGNAVRLDAGANDNVLNASSLVSNTGTWMALFVVGGKRNAVTGSYLQNNAGTGVYFYTDSDSNVVSDSTIVAHGGSNGAYYVLSSTGNTLTGSLILASATHGVRIELSKQTSVVNSTVTGASGSLYAALTVVQSSVTAVLGCYVQGSTAVWIDRSTATSVGYGALVSAAPTGAALAMTGGIGLQFSSNTVSGSAQAAAVRLVGAGGYLEISTSAFKTGAKYGVYIASTAAGAQVSIASNTILVSTSSSRDTYGVYLGNLASGASVFNNGIFYRVPGTMGAFMTYGAFVASSPGVSMRRNRVDNPGMITGGSLVALLATGAQGLDFEFNDVNSTGTGLTLAYHLQLIGSTAAVRNNVLLSSWTATTKADLRLDAASGVDSNYNDWFSSNALAMSWGSQNYASLAAWQAVGKDAGSLSAHPQWFDASAGVEDFHPRSSAGRWNGASFVSDSVDSPTLDAGDPSLPLGAEPANSGCIVNQGSYGGLAETSRSPSVLSVSLSTAAPSYYDFGSITLGAVPSTVSLNANVIDNAGTVSESFQLSAATIAPSGLVMALGEQAGIDMMRLQGLFHSATPAPALFDVNASTITGVMQKADTTRYAGDQSGYQVPPSVGQCAGSARSLWFKLTPPTTSIYGAPGSQQQQKIRVTVTGILDP